MEGQLRKVESDTNYDGNFSEGVAATGSGYIDKVGVGCQTPCQRVSDTVGCRKPVSFCFAWYLFWFVFAYLETLIAPYL